MASDSSPLVDKLLKSGVVGAKRIIASFGSARLAVRNQIRSVSFAWNREKTSGASDFQTLTQLSLKIPTRKSRSLFLLGFSVIHSTKITANPSCPLLPTV